MYEYQGFWYLSVDGVEGVMSAQQNFKPRREDILLVTLPKAGATWFKPLPFSVMTRFRPVGTMVFRPITQWVHGSFGPCCEAT